MSRFNCPMRKYYYICRLNVKNTMDKYFNRTRVIGVDISLNKTSYAIVDVRGNIIARGSFRTIDYPIIDDFVSELCKQLNILIAENGGFESIRSIGISAPSANYRTGCIENSPNMPWKGVIPLSAMIRDRLGIAVAISNDCKAIAMGEWAFGSAHGMRNFAVVTLGHGMGSAFYTNGKIVNGNSGLSGEYGHSCIVPHGRKCECGLEGCLKTYVAEKGVMRTARELLKESDAPSLMRNIDDKDFTPKYITECCDKGDQLAIEVYRRTGHILGLGLSNLASLLDPEAIIITGGISLAGKWLFEPTEEAFNEHLFHNLYGKVKILKSALDRDDRDVLGASVLAWNVKEYSLFL